MKAGAKRCLIAPLCDFSPLTPVPRSILILAFISSALCLPGRGDATVDYMRDVKPLLATACVQCHGAANPKANLRLDTAKGAFAGGDNGPAIVKGAPGKSFLVTLLHGAQGDIPQMPYKRNPLSEEQIATLSEWIAEGATAPDQEEPSMWTHWSFQPPKREKAGVDGKQAIDAFINAELKKHGLTANPRADAATLIRRLSLDLTGLPPSVAEVEAFAKAYTADSVTAMEALVDRLLASPHYGERWGRWWLDQARYADSNGYSIDAPRSIWPYRDWVVNALNTNLRFDEFTIEQLAGDLIGKPTRDQLVATGFHRNTQVNNEGGIDPEQFRIDAVFDRVATTGTVWLGLTIGCSQCHDHKFDPITQKEYYGLFAFFNNSEQDGHGGTKTSTIVLPDVRKNLDALKREATELEKKVATLLPERLPAITAWEAGLRIESRKKLSKEVKKALGVPSAARKPSDWRLLYTQFAFNDAEFKGVNDRLKEIEGELANQVTTLVMKELPEPRETHLFTKGDFTRPAEVVKPHTPHVLPPLGRDADKVNRLDLAKWLVRRDNPLTARVIMNRVWQVYFGKGIVETENDFGTQSSAPSHPELLDWLACEFMDSGWDLKHMHKLIVLSEAYLRSSQSNTAKANVAADPLNRFLWRQNRLRLDAEAVRDVCLTVTGLLNPQLGGPPVYPPIPEGAMSVGQVKRPWPTSTGPDRYRRGLYTFFFRATPHPSLTVFDAPDSFTTCTRRIRSNTPLQALTLLNDSAYFEFAQALAKIVEREGLPAAFARCMSRQPTAAEVARLQGLDALTTARVLLNLDETITRE